MGTRGRRHAVLTVLAALVLAGCGSASDPSPPAGVDGLVIPTPSVDPDDFVTGVDNPWLPLPVGATWEYAVTGVRQGSTTVTTLEGPDVEGVATTAVRAETTPEKGAPTVVTDFYAQDAAGNVWWFGREGEWLAGKDDAEAGLVMAADPRVGDGYRQAEAAGVDRRAEVIGARRRGAASRRARTTTWSRSPSPRRVTGVVGARLLRRGCRTGVPEDGRGCARTAAGLVAYDEP